MGKILTHRGFTITVPQSGGVDGYIEYPLTDVLYERVRVTRRFDTDFAFVSDVVRTAKEVLFINGQFSLAIQLRLPASRRVHAFAADTLRYLSGQPRQMSLENYRDLLMFHPKEKIELDHRTLVRAENLEWAFTTPPATILSTWLSKDQGLADLATTMQLMAGALPDNWDDLSEAID